MPPFLTFLANLIKSCLPQKLPSQPTPAQHLAHKRFLINVKITSQCTLPFNYFLAFVPLHWNYFLWLRSPQWESRFCVMLYLIAEIKFYFEYTQHRNLINVDVKNDFKFFFIILSPPTWFFLSRSFCSPFSCIIISPPGSPIFSTSKQHNSALVDWFQPRILKPKSSRFNFSRTETWDSRMAKKVKWNNAKVFSWPLRLRVVSQAYVS